MVTPPPDDEFKALTRLIYLTILDARSEAWQGEIETNGVTKARFSKIARLMDAIHNIPGFLVKYDKRDQGFFEMYLGDESSESGQHLRTIYLNALKEARTNANVANDCNPDA